MSLTTSDRERFDEMEAMNAYVDELKAKIRELECVLEGLMDATGVVFTAAVFKQHMASCKSVPCHQCKLAVELVPAVDRAAAALEAVDRRAAMGTHSESER